eukprot:SAG31_NODE_12109_length_967_cov_1.948157_1_plen_74_part_10
MGPPGCSALCRIGVALAAAAVVLTAVNNVADVIGDQAQFLQVRLREIAGVGPSEPAAPAVRAPRGLSASVVDDL